MKPKKNQFKQYVLLLIIVSTVIRAFIAANIELGNDEVYYRLYALYPDWSHFDHPLMVGWVIQFFSLNLLFDSEFFLRLGSIVFGAINIWLMFRIGTTIKNERTGFYASFLYVGSIYATVITGIFILPDTPLSLFWLLGIYLMVKTLPEGPENKRSRINIVVLGFVLGLGMLSKYTTVFLWLGVGFFILIYKREWFKSASLYIALFISLICVLTVLIWNFQNDFISFTFHGSRVDVSGQGLNSDSFLREIAGEFFYNNPINFFLIILAIVSIIEGKLRVAKPYIRLILLSTFPLIFIFLGFSFFRDTLPHWSAPAYTTLIVLAAAWLDQYKIKTIRNGYLTASVALILVVLIFGYIQIEHGVLNLGGEEKYETIGRQDPTLDMYGFRQVGEAFEEIVARDIIENIMPENSAFIGDNWYPLANYDYYAASPIGMKSYGISDLDHLHKYAWINSINGGFKPGMSGYYITDSKHYHQPNTDFRYLFESVEPADTIQIYRNGVVVKRAFIWRMKNMVKLPEDPFLESP